MSKLTGNQHCPTDSCVINHADMQSSDKENIILWFVFWFYSYLVLWNTDYTACAVRCVIPVVATEHHSNSKYYKS